MLSKEELKQRFVKGAKPTEEDFAALIESVEGPRGEKGERGEDGRSFSFADLTPEQIEMLRGHKGNDGYTPQKNIDYFDGKNGRDGIDGKTAYEIAVQNGFIGDEATWLASLKGERGERGEQGERGEDGRPFLFDDLTPEQHDLLKGIQGPKGDPGLFHTQSNNQLKLWKGTTTVAKDGKWIANYADAGFTSVIAVIPIFSANAHDSDPAGMAIGGGVINTTITNTSAQGYAVKGLAAGLLAAMTSTWASEGTIVHVTVIGH